jgi:hypothetical protein
MNTTPIISEICAMSTLDQQWLLSQMSSYERKTLSKLLEERSPDVLALTQEDQSVAGLDNDYDAGNLVHELNRSDAQLLPEWAKTLLFARSRLHTQVAKWTVSIHSLRDPKAQRNLRATPHAKAALRRAAGLLVKQSSTSNGSGLN